MLGAGRDQRLRNAFDPDPRARSRPARIRRQRLERVDSVGSHVLSESEEDHHSVCHPPIIPGRTDAGGGRRRRRVPPARHADDIRPPFRRQRDPERARSRWKRSGFEQRRADGDLRRVVRAHRRAARRVLAARAPARPRGGGRDHACGLLRDHRVPQEVAARTRRGPRLSRPRLPERPFDRCARPRTVVRPRSSGTDRDRSPRPARRSTQPGWAPPSSSTPGTCPRTSVAASASRPHGQPRRHSS